MRIISGKHKGRRLSPPKQGGVRPTTDFARESLFSLIENRMNIDGIIALDLFSGTGAISFELGSRGAKNIQTIDTNVKMLSFIKKEANLLDLPITTIKNNVFKWLKSAKGKYDLIFADPPYNIENYLEIPTLVFDADLLSNDGWLIIEHPSQVSFAEHPHFESLRTYGAVHFSFFNKRN